jgi:hypothetical protein
MAVAPKRARSARVTFIVMVVEVGLVTYVVFVAAESDVVGDEEREKLCVLWVTSCRLRRKAVEFF